MRVGNVGGRAAPVTADQRAVDVHQASGGRFGPDLRSVHDAWPDFSAWARHAAVTDAAPVDPVGLGAPPPKPRQILPVGLNYRAHAAESGFDTPTGLPPIFPKFASSLSGPVTEVALPDGGDKGAFLRCSDDHHNFLALAAPVNYLHHTSWQVGDIDDVGRGAAAMLAGDPRRHVWGMGRHHAGSNFSWYLKDPAGNFSEYFSDMDCIPEDEIWEPEVLEGAKGLFNWGPPPPPSFLNPDDLAGLMTGVHSKA